MRTSAWIQRVLLICLLAGAMLAPLFVPGLRPTDFALRTMQRDLDRVADENAADHLRKIATFGEPAIPIVVGELASSYPPRSAAAYRVLNEELAKWRSLPPVDSSRRVAVLGRELAAHQPQMSSTPAAGAARLAMEILNWPVDRQAIDAVRLLADCRRVVGQQPVREPEQPPAAVPAEQVATAEEIGDDGPRLPSLPAPPTDAVAGSTSFSLSDESDSPGSETGPVRMALGDDPAAGGDDLPPVISGSASTEVASGGQPAGSQRFSLSDDASGDGQVAGPEPSLTANHLPPLDLRNFDDVEVMRHLHSDVHRYANAAHDELLRRGFTESHMQLAQQLFHRDPAIRQQLAFRLPNLADVDARPWLLQLSHDPHPSVRRAVIALLATSSDPQLHERLRQLEFEESDPALLEQVRNLLTDQRVMR